MHDLPEADFTQRFIFDDADVRGEAVALERSYAEVLAKHDYPLPVQLLLGEFMAAAALLVGTLKFDGLLILQARSEGPVPLLMIGRLGDGVHQVKVAQASGMESPSLVRLLDRLVSDRFER